VVSGILPATTFAQHSVCHVSYRSRLDRSSPDSDGQLGGALCVQEYQQCVPNLQDNGLVRFAEHLDEVCRHVAFSCSLFKSVWALSDLDPSSPTSRMCLRKLKNIRGTRVILPTPYTSPPNLPRHQSQPIRFKKLQQCLRGVPRQFKACVERGLKGVRDRPQIRFTITLTPTQPNILGGDSGHTCTARFVLAMVVKSVDSMKGGSRRLGHTWRWSVPEILIGKGPVSHHICILWT